MYVAQYIEKLPVISGNPLYTVKNKFRLQVLANTEVHAYYKVVEKYNVYNTRDSFYIIYDVKVHQMV